MVGRKEIDSTTKKEPSEFAPPGVLFALMDIHFVLPKAIISYAKRKCNIHNKKVFVKVFAEITIKSVHKVVAKR